MGCFWLKNEKNQLKFFFAARSTFYLLNLAREQKSLATPDLYDVHCIAKYIGFFIKTKQIEIELKIIALIKRYAQII